MHLSRRHRDRYRAFARFSSYAVMMAGLLVLAGWITDTRVLTSFLPGFARIKFSSGLALVLAGASLRLLAMPRGSGVLRAASQVCALAAVAIGAAVLAEYAGNTDFGINQWPFAENDAPAGQIPGRMPLISAVIFVLAGSALFLLARNARALWVEGAVLLAAGNALVPVIGYLYGKTALYQVPYYGTVAFPITLVFLLLCAGILALRPERGMMALISNDSAGGFTARRLLPAALLLPVAIERLQFWGHEAGLYDLTVGMILITLASMGMFTLLILWNAYLLLRLDKQRSEAEDTVRQALDVLESNLNALSASNTRLLAASGERRAMEETLFHEHERAQVTLNSIADGVVTTDVDGKISYMNPAAETLSGWPNAEAAGKTVHEVFKVVDTVTRQPLAYSLSPVLDGSTTATLPPQIILVHRDGRESTVNNSCAPIHRRDGKVMGAVLVLHDVSALHAMTLKMSYVTQHDALTGLPNRFLLNDRLSQALALALPHNTRTALLFLDLDRFKHVNDTLGHAVGDRLLQEIADRLKRCKRDTDTVGRYGGDEFAILLPEIGDTLAAARAAGQCLTAMTEPFSIDGHEIHISASIGISICPEDGQDSETIIRHAEAAMYQAKAQGRNNYQFFMPRINERAIRRFALEGSLRRAIAREESALYYQPKLSIADRRVIGAEALIRWHDQRSGPVSPSQFIPIAEESGLIIPIGEWVLRKACRQNRAWQDAGYEALPIAVNVSAVQFREKHFLEMVARVLEETRLEPRYLELELTESVTMQDIDLTIQLLEALKRMGVSLSIDDFGTGYSSLSYLKRFPIDALKIDKSFVQDIVTDADDAAITCAIISMAKSLKHRVIAEGVETAEQFEFLRRHGCDAIQGYYFSGPLSAQEFEHRILQRAATVQ
ncbi:MAG TPA: EAL domain-containing protein [Noviherbaspirillum sp.]|uniref:putative bifunctional diguanylate cyclase/phosphodiesterase n=1 Tax=Noviherbaspirillum sp. TaxID=1926288 RepID=UPI002D6A3F22|nr:EAL domain-containing protein [Noviherbaspirillum sp.]HYD97567.1 EAL domain-containing protein [Noviherbaspirillum sp.]